MISRFLSVFLVSICLMSQVAQAISPADYARLKTGKVLVNPQATTDTAARAVEAIILIQRPLAQVWSVMKQTEAIMSGDPTIKKIQVVKRPSPSREIVKYDIKLAPMVPMMSYIAQIDFNPYQGTTFKRLSGSFEAMDGSTRLEQGKSANETILYYKLMVKPGMPLPQGMVNRIVGADLPRTLGRVKQKVYQAYPVAPVKTATKD